MQRIHVLYSDRSLKWLAVFTVSARTLCSGEKFRASNILLKSAEYAIKRKEHFGFLAYTSCQDRATVTHPIPPSPAKYQFALQQRGLGQDFLCLSLSHFSLIATDPYEQRKSLIRAHLLAGDVTQKPVPSAISEEIVVFTTAVVPVAPSCNKI
jgi:hypothetical protein